MKHSEEKTNVMRILDAKKLPYQGHIYASPEEGAISGEQVADVLGQDPRRVFKTLVTEGSRGGHFVFMIPVCAELDLKKAAKAAGEKSVAMLKSKELLPLTGYVHGGCSPIGMKKAFPTFLDASAQDEKVIFFSAGRIGAQIEMAPQDLEKAVRIGYAALTVEEQI